MKEGRMVRIRRQMLLWHLAKYAYSYKPEDFALTSGFFSKEYIDCRQPLSAGFALHIVGLIFSDMLKEDVRAVGGLETGAYPIAIATALVGTPGNPINWFGVRKDNKGHGMKKLIEGYVPKGTKVAIVDDVATTGGSTIEAIRKSRLWGLQVVQVIVLVDRQEGGLQRIEKEVGPTIPVSAIFTKREIREEWEKLQANEVQV